MDFSNISTEDLQAQLADLMSQAEALQESGDLDTLAEVLDKIDAINGELASRAEEVEVEASRAELAKRFDAAKSRFAVHSSKPKARKTPVTRPNVPDKGAEWDSLKSKYNFASAIIDTIDGRSLKGAEAEYVSEVKYQNPAFRGIPVPRYQSYAGANSTDAPNVINTNYLPGQVDMLRAGSIVDKFGFTVYDNLTQPISITVQTADPSGNWVAEGNTSTAGTPGYTQVALTPKTNIVIVPTTRKFLVSVPDAKDQLGKQIAAKCRNEMDYAIVAGAGGAAPTGLINNAAVQANTNSNHNFSGAITYAGCLEMYSKCATMNGLTDQAAWLTNFKVEASARAVLRSANNFKFILDDDGKILGYDVVANSLVPSNLGSPATSSPLVLIGDPSAVIVAFFGSDNFEVVVDNYTQLDSGGIRLAIPFSMDTAVRQPGNVVVARDVSA